MKIQNCTSYVTDTQKRDWKENVSIFILMEAYEDGYFFYLYSSHVWQQSCFTLVIEKKLHMLFLLF